MTSFKRTSLAAAAIAFLIGTGASFAQTTPAPATDTPAPAAEPAKAKPVKKTALSKQCSAEADKQSLHGKARKKFRAECMHKATM